MNFIRLYYFTNRLSSGILYKIQIPVAVSTRFPDIRHGSLCQKGGICLKYIGLLAAFAVGASLSYLGYRWLKTVMKRNQRRYPLVMWLRTVVSVIYLVALFALGQYTALDLPFLLIGGALGVTLPTFCFTVMLLKHPAETGGGKENDHG